MGACTRVCHIGVDTLVSLHVGWLVCLLGLIPRTRYDTDPQGLGMRPMLTTVCNVCWYF